ncbi:protein-L-isoaspartate(D-aspartate) O-methyltransferase [Hydrogenophaga palleronii]|uniref:protein-L-isoaspartate(D-aspartate) O-methyltransferase n=1 Tax=Hydrogenophaga palleronii TaxID=65655 RepID=UPI00286C7EFC|nr:protein-L-isoaspartate(D-aspartate) O-methyltransferase [Hydrogenophaga palleronii]
MRPRPSFPVKLTTAQQAPQGRSQVGASGQGPRVQAVGKPAAFAPVQVGREPSRPPVRKAHGTESQAARLAMVRKLETHGIRHPAVLAAMGKVERHRFVDSALANQAYEDTSLPIGLGQTISKPSVVARMIELLCHDRPGKLGRVLEIGTGCGYQAAVLSVVATEVYSMERLRGLHERARENLRLLRLANLHLLMGDGMLGFAKGAPYAAIIAAAGGNDIPQAWLEQLAVGGRLVAPTVTATGQQNLVVVDKTARGLVRTELEAVHFVPLKSGIG